ncbi:DUF3231 family protein [Oceanobacillus senegalensis]|uniref:DUF3231 family protein n=1 Tax=Oceanobacillus senegalensis TaxID=1936063 RepID=UPI000A308000|nr:DUF3231 family protein [Oceanobacillus senegalensis]
MNNNENMELTAAEIYTLWSQYQEKTLAICILKHALNHVDDNEIKALLGDTLDIMNSHIEKLTHFFHKEQYPIPKGFSEKDVNIQAPRIFSDNLYLLYILNSCYITLGMYAMHLASAEREDIIEYYNESLTQAQKYHQRAKMLAKEKAIYTPSPHIPKPDKVEFVEKKSFLNGWFGRRPLMASEIANLTFNAQRNAIGQAAITAFSQIASSKEVRKYFERGRDIAGKHFEIFHSILNNEYLSEGSSIMTSEVTDSTQSPFSDKLMMYLVTGLISAGITQYGKAIAESPRHDLGLQYSRLTMEIANYADDGTKIMIDHGWMEQPPMATDRKNLAK